MSENQIGRPTKYKPEYCQQLIDHMSAGLSFESFAGIAKVNQDTLHEWAKVYEEFSEAKKEAFASALLFWEKLGIDNIINKSESFGEGQSESRSLNASIWIFNMKNRFKWRDKQPDESDVIVNNFTSETDDNLDRKIEEKMKKLGGSEA